MSLLHHQTGLATVLDETWCYNSFLLFPETAAQYEARIAVLQSQPVEWRRPSGQNLVSV